jgi:hypothetical protein
MSAALILRVWLEGDADELRGRLTTVDTSVGTDGGELTVCVTASTDETVAAVRGWLDDFLARATHPIDGRK